MAGMCGKDCGNCETRQRNGCRGCLETEGVPIWGACRAAACCRSQGYPDCSGCDARTSCGKPEEAEEARRRWTAEEGEYRNRWREGMARRAPVLAQWLPVLFWLLLCSEVVNLVDQRVSLSGIWDGISLVVSTVLAIGMLVVFWKLAPLSRRFRTVWRIELALQIVSVGLLVFLFLMEDSLDTASALPGVAVAGLLLVAVGLVAAGMAARCFFYGAIAVELEESVLPQPPGAIPEDRPTPVPLRLAENWRLLRKFTLASTGTLLGGLLVALLVIRSGSPGVAIALLVVFLIAALVLVGCMVAELVLTWKSAAFFRSIRIGGPPLPEPETDEIQ